MDADISFAAFEAYTQGFGSKILKRWGWKEGKGLGRNEDGLPEAPTAHKRSPGIGLGWGDEYAPPEPKRQKLQPAEIVVIEIEDNDSEPEQLNRFPSELCYDLQHFISGSYQTYRSLLSKPNPISELKCTRTNAGLYQNLLSAFPQLSSREPTNPFELALESLQSSILASCNPDLLWQALDYFSEFEEKCGKDNSKEWKLGIIAFLVTLAPICERVSAWEVHFYDRRIREDDLYYQVRFVTTCHRHLKPFVNFETSIFWSFINETVFLKKVQCIIEKGWVLGETDEATIEVISEWSGLLGLDPFLENFITTRLLNYAKGLPWHLLFPRNRSLPEVEEGEKFVVDLTVAEEPSEEEEADLRSIDLKPLLTWISYSGFNSEPISWCLFEKVYKQAKIYRRCSVTDSGFRHGLLHFQDIPDLFEQLVEALVLRKLRAYLVDLKDLLFEIETIVSSEDMTTEDLHLLEASGLNMLDTFLSWRDVVRDSELMDMLEELFFPSWLTLFSKWLKQPQDITRFYSRWKELFSKYDLVYPPVAACFERALHLMRVEMEVSGFFTSL
jgi:hypothetical protein